MAAVAQKTENQQTSKKGTTEATTVELMLSKGTNALVEKAKPHFSVVDNVPQVSDDFYVQMLPSDVAKKYLKDESIESLYEVKQALDKHETQLTAATGLLTAEAFVDAAAKDPSLSEWSLRYKANTAVVCHRVHREKDMRHPTTGATTKKFAVIQTTIKVQAAKGSSGDLSRVKGHANTLGAQYLS